MTFQVVIDQNSRFLYAMNWYGNSISAFSIEQSQGKLTAISTTTVTSPFDAKIYSTYDGNDPPVANAGTERNIKTGDTAPVFGHLSFDPDATRCVANPARYVYGWRFLSRPGGSSAVLTNSNSLTTASFIPDIVGDYIVELSFKDDAGICNGTDKTSRATATFHASANPPPPPAPPRYPEPPPPPPPPLVIEHLIGGECWAVGPIPQYITPPIFEGYGFCDSSVDGSGRLQLTQPRSDAQFRFVETREAEYGLLDEYAFVGWFPFPTSHCGILGPWELDFFFCSKNFLGLPFAFYFWHPYYTTTYSRIQWFWTEIIPP